MERKYLIIGGITIAVVGLLVVVFVIKSNSGGAEDNEPKGFFQRLKNKLKTKQVEKLQPQSSQPQSSQNPPSN
jgi:hypothetical protein